MKKKERITERERNKGIIHYHNCNKNKENKHYGQICSDITYLIIAST